MKTRPNHITHRRVCDTRKIPRVPLSKRGVGGFLPERPGVADLTDGGSVDYTGSKREVVWMSSMASTEGAADEGPFARL